MSKCIENKKNIFLKIKVNYNRSKLCLLRIIYTNIFSFQVFKSALLIKFERHYTEFRDLHSDCKFNFLDILLVSKLNQILLNTKKLFVKSLRFKTERIFSKYKIH